MKIVCESCGAKYSIADEKVAGKVFKIRCKKCSAVIVVKGDQQQEAAADAASAVESAGDAVWHVVVAGEQQGPFAPRQIGELLAEGKIDWEAYVWREGMDNWQPAKDVEELVKAVMAESEGGESAASGAAAGSGEVFGGSSDMGADPFASSDDGGLSGVIGQAAAASSAASGGADLFADSNRNAFAAASDDDERSGASNHPGRGPKVSEAQSMTGQRNENSVLFSLSNLQALATGSGAAPTTSRAKPGMAQGEGSGLIDIRALASATQAVADKPNGSSRDKVEDLLAVGATNTTFSSTALASPVAVEKADHSKTILIGMAAAIMALGVAVTYLVTRQPDPQPTAQLTPAQETAPGAAVAAAGAANSPTAAAPRAADPGTQEPAAGDSAKEPEGRDNEDREDDNERGERSSRRSSRERSSEKSERGEKAEKGEKAEAAPVAAAEPVRKSSTGDESIDDLLNTALGGKAKPAAAPKPPAENLQSTPSREDVLSAMKSVTSKVQACGAGQSGIAMAKVGVAGPTGKVTGVDVSGQFAGTPAASCISKEVSRAKFPKFSQSTFSFSYPFKI
jgi:predicted Zn finger-like uncharacterized protein